MTYPFTIHPWTLDLPPAVTYIRFTRSESTYDEFGYTMPYTLVCCGNCWEQTRHSRSLKLANYNDNFEYYIEVSQERVQQFLDAHKECSPKCWNCMTAPVEKANRWCEECSE